MLLQLLLATATAAPQSGQVYVGRERQTNVPLPRLTLEVTIDGQLDEPAWSSAALLTGFSQYSPNDQVAAADSTHVYVWYSPTAIHFGIRAFDASGARATVAERDQIFTDDNVQILLGTFNDGRQAAFFAVNPLGAQADGVLVERGREGGGYSSPTVVREAPDLSPDYVFESKGRLTDAGYEVEIRIPFKSLRYNSGPDLTWGLNVVRQTQRTGHEDSWAPATRSAASFLVQSGRLTGLTDLRRGLVLDMIPEVTNRWQGAASATGWGYDAQGAQFGGTVRWGITNNLTLNGTANPDFSQVESDAGQIAFDPRLALFFPERRPFFLDGIEQFSVPNRLIHTRRIVQPEAAVKLTGKVGGTDVGLLSSVDDRIGSVTGEDNPIVNLLRVQQDVGKQSRLGLVYTDRIDGDDYNRVAGVDGRVVTGGIYAFRFQGALSRTRSAGLVETGPLWDARFNRDGRQLGIRYRITGIADDFDAQSGFINRVGIVLANFVHSWTIYGKEGALLENLTGDVTLDGTWKYDSLFAGAESQDRKMHLNFNTRLRGGWNFGASVLIESFGYDPDLYADYAIEVPAGGGLDTVAFTGTPRLYNLDWVVRAATPEFSKFSADAFVLWGKDENFFEWSSGDIVVGDGGITFRPVPQLRLDARYILQRVARHSDGSRVDLKQLTRVVLQYQPTRSLFARFIGQYSTADTDSLRDDSRTNAPILIRDPGTGIYQRAGAKASQQFRGDVLVSYVPTPGTIVFVGYGSTLVAPNALREKTLTREDDGFFLKLSYLFRI